MLIPISAPKPNRNPSAKRVDAFHKTLEESTSSRNLSAREASSVMILSVCPEPCVLINFIASDNLGTTITESLRSVYSVSQSTSTAGFISEMILRVRSQPTSSTFFKQNCLTKGGSISRAISSCTRRVSMALHAAGYCSFESRAIEIALSGSAFESIYP